MFMVRRPSRHRTVLLRYYICDEDKLRWRIPAGLHHKILAGELPIPAFAGTRQKVLEVFISPADRQKVLEVRGSIYSFQEDGSFDESAAVELMPSVWQQEIKKTPSGAIDASAKFQYRRWLNENTWTPKQSLRRSVIGRAQRPCVST